MADRELWIFGYGSLVGQERESCVIAHNSLRIYFQVWKNNDFEYELKKTGCIKGFARRFYQNSIDHRGVPEKPGRVVTLVKSNDPESIVYGMGYKIASDKVTEVLDHLDFREKNGYDRHETTFYQIGGILIYSEELVY